MSSPANYSDVLNQLRDAGLLVDHLDIGRLVRCKVEGEREKRGWYSLHEIRGSGGDALIVGSFGIWRGNDAGTLKIALRKADELSQEQREAIKRRVSEDLRRAKAAREALARRAALRASRIWAKCSPTGESDYLVRKGVQAHGLRFTPSGAAVIPFLDTGGNIHGLQFILAGKKTKRGLGKMYWPEEMATKGHFFLIGIPQSVLLLAEGYATAASLHEATGLPTAIAFDANNLIPVASALHGRYRQARILICADDDYLKKCRECREYTSTAARLCFHCGKPHGETNSGVVSASAAAVEVDGAWIAPLFDEQIRKQAFDAHKIRLTDFNDLHQSEGLQVVRTQIETRILELGWRLTTRARAPRIEDGEGGAAPLKPIESLQELLDRFALVYGQSGTVFDHQEHILMPLSDMRDACLSRQLHRAWAEDPDRMIVRAREVGFDPAGEDEQITCNLWAGWPTTPKKGKCTRLLELLEFMCSLDPDGPKLYDWVIKWIAYPIQHPGAKMKTTLVLHGPQGAGKNMFFETLMKIYGPYGRVIDQTAIEDKFNDWASRKLFLIADEVVARSDLYHVKNKLKAFITGDWIRINPKNIAAYDERNHVNILFLSNELMPVVLEEDDRRHGVIWTPKELAPEFYADVLDEIDNGGAAALHDHLLHLDLGNFHEGTRPPMNAAKAELINQSLDSTSRFFYELEGGQIDGVSARPALSRDVYLLYRHWCGQQGLRSAPMPRLINVFNRRHGIEQMRKRYTADSAIGLETRGPHGVLILGKEQGPTDSENEISWLGRHIAAFRASVNDYRGMSAHE